MPLSLEEEMPWECQRLRIGTGAYGRLPIMHSVRSEAKIGEVTLLMLTKEKAIEILNEYGKDTKAILHVTC